MTEPKIKIIAFIGPSIPEKRAKRLLPEAEFRPPAKQSDILNAVENDRPDVIILIDGYFHQNLSPWHKEILYALSKGIHVFGASSMGALRAIELEEFGMVGVGKVFNRLKKMAVAPDDWVAVSQDSDGNALSIPMVDVFETLDAIEDQDALSEEACKEIANAFKNSHFHNRTLALVPKEHREIAKSFYVNQKQKDAEECLKLVAESFDELSSPLESSFTFTGGNLFEAQFDRDRAYRIETGEEVPRHLIESSSVVENPLFSAINYNAANRQASLILAKMIGLELHREVDKSKLSRVQIEELYIAQLHRAIRTSRVHRKNTGIFCDFLEASGTLEDAADFAHSREACFRRLEPDYNSTPIPGDDILDSFTPAQGIDAMLEQSGLSLLELKIELEKRMIVNGATG